jgi:hypothetical protein
MECPAARAELGGYFPSDGPDKALSSLASRLGFGRALQAGPRRSNDLYREVPCCPRDKDPLASTDFVWIANAVDPSQFFILDAVSLAYAKEVLITYDNVIDAAGFPLEWKA